MGFSLFTGAQGATGPQGPTGPTGPAFGAAAVLFVDVTLTGGTGTQASGKTLSAAKIIGVYLLTPTTATGVPVAAISTNDITITSYTAGAIQAVADASTYRVALVGWT